MNKAIAAKRDAAAVQQWLDSGRYVEQCRTRKARGAGTTRMRGAGTSPHKVTRSGHKARK